MIEGLKNLNKLNKLYLASNKTNKNEREILNSQYFKFELITDND